MDYDVIIVGAGPAGLFCAYELLNQNKKICLIELGNSIKNRTPKEVMCGVGGAGTFSDGKLHFTPVLSHEKILDLYSIPEYQNYLDRVDQIFRDFGDLAETFPKNINEVNKLVEKCRKKDIYLYVRKVRHIGSDQLPKIIANFESHLIENGVDLKSLTEVTDILLEENKIKGVITDKGEKLSASNVVLAPGRYNARWLQHIAKRYSLPFKYEKIEVGVRVEFSQDIMKQYTDLMYEPIFSIRTKTFDDIIRTFCPCPQGKVAIEEYEDFVCVNGHSNNSHDSKNSNFAFTTEVELTEPLENTISYGKSIAKLATTLGGGKPIIQRLADLKKGRRSTWNRINKSMVDPSLKNAVPGDISMALPHRIITNILEGLEALDEVMPGINSGSTLLYAPEIKLRSSKLLTSKSLETPIKGLYVAGDGAGVAGNIVGAAATGLIVAQGILG